MIDGKYTIEINTSLGSGTGTVDLKTEGDTVRIHIDAPVIGEQKAKGKVDGDSFTAKGALEIFLLGDIEYKLHGEVVGDKLNIVIDSSKGELKLVGERA